LSGRLPSLVADRQATPDRERESIMRYIAAWLLGVPFGIIVLWFLANQVGC
jgi:hypothetical protein